MGGIVARLLLEVGLKDKREGHDGFLIGCEDFIEAIRCVQY